MGLQEGVVLLEEVCLQGVVVLLEEVVQVVGGLLEGVGLLAEAAPLA